MAAYSYFRDRDGTLCREVARQREVWFPERKVWSPYFWKSTDVVEITPAAAREMGGEAAVPYPLDADGRIRVEVRVPFPPVE